jgi:hypothetical protein
MGAGIADVLDSTRMIYEVTNRLKEESEEQGVKERIKESNSRMAHRI